MAILLLGQLGDSVVLPDEGEKSSQNHHNMEGQRDVNHRQYTI